MYQSSDWHFGFHLFQQLTHPISIPQLLVEKPVITRFVIKENNYHYIDIR